MKVNVMYFFLWMVIILFTEKESIRCLKINSIAEKNESKLKNEKNNLYENNKLSVNQPMNPTMQMNNMNNLGKLGNIRMQSNQKIPMENYMNNLNNVKGVSMQNMLGVNSMSNAGKIQMTAMQNIPTQNSQNSQGNIPTPGINNINPMINNGNMNIDPSNKAAINGINGMNSINVMNGINGINGMNGLNPGPQSINPNQGINSQFANQIPANPLNPNLNPNQIPSLLNPNVSQQFSNPLLNSLLNKDSLTIPPLNIIKENYFDARLNEKYEKVFRKLDKDKPFEKTINKNSKPAVPEDEVIPLAGLLKMAFDYKLIEKSVIITSVHKNEKSRSLKDNYLNLNKNPQTLILKAQTDIEPKTVLITIDKTLILNIKNSATKLVCVQISKLEQFKHNSDKICLALYIVTRLTESEVPNSYDSFQEKLLSDYFKSFRDNQNYKKFPVFYPKAFYYKLIAGTYFNELLKARIHLFEKEYDLIIKHTKVSKTEIDFKDFVKARLYVTSRNLNIVNRQGDNLSSIPILIDQVKRTTDQAQANCNFDYKSGKFYLTSIRKITKGEELMLMNPSLSNSDSLTNFGYTIPSNYLISEVFLYIKINSNKESTDQPAILEDQISVLLLANFNLNEVLKSFRMMQANYLKHEQAAANAGPISIDNEILALQVFRKALRTKIMKYPTNLESDTVVMKYKTLSENELNLYRISIEEKYIVVFYFNMASLFEKFISKIKNAQIVEDNMIGRISKDKYYKYYYSFIKDLMKDFIKDQSFFHDDTVFAINPNVDGNSEFSVEDLDEMNIHEMEEQEFQEEEEDEEEEKLKK